MRNRSKIIIIILIIIALIAGIYSYTSYENYQNITMNGLKCEVPESNVNITNSSDYQIYDNTKNNLKIIVYDEYQTNDTNETSSFDEVKNTAQTNITSLTKANVTYNKSQSGLCSYYGNYSGRNVLITTPNENTLIHILQTLKVEPLENVEVDETLENDTGNNQATDKKSDNSKSSKTSSKSKSSGGSKSSSTEGYYYSPQFGDYIREYTSSDGVQHTQGLHGAKASYNPKNGYVTYTDTKGKTYSDYFV